MKTNLYNLPSRIRFFAHSRAGGAQVYNEAEHKATFDLRLAPALPWIVGGVGFIAH